MKKDGEIERKREVVSVVEVEEEDVGEMDVIEDRWVFKHRWFSGRMLACHAGGPGSIPGRCKEDD